ncbi:MAG TPA: hypothetical protein DEF36_12170 [Desulfotomaculum sp.]|nr:hypothetical protein [Desulfotomaculum sp.]
MITPEELINTLSGGQQSAVTRLGKIPDDYVSGAATVIFDGEGVATTKTYPLIGGYVPAAGDRVVLQQCGHSWVIIGKVVAEPAPTAIPSGVILMWSGTEVSIPTGWALCNGQNGTPDLRNRFVVGAGTDGEYAVGDTGGEKTHALTINEMPYHGHAITVGSDGSHSHTYIDGKASGDAQAGTGTYGGQTWDSRSTTSDGSHSHTASATNTGGGATHENRPPYYALCFIQKL